MDNAEKFGWLREAVRSAFNDRWDEVNPDTLLQFLDEIEERWDMFEEDN